MKKLILVLMISLVGISVQAQENTIKKNKNKEVIIKVNGNCGMCEKRIEKAAFSVKGVKKAEWHIDCQDMHLIIDENKCSVDQVHEAVAKEGHDTDKVKAKDEDYERLHHCCQFERKQ
jgi:copper chaperone CopZ